MKIERTQNASRNIISGTVLKIYQMMMPFIMRTVIIYVLGAEYLGLNSLFTSILHVLNMAELGVGSAMIFSMYEPISRDDTEKINALMKLYRKYYRVIGAVVLVIGLALIPFLPRLIKDDVPNDVNITALYLLNLFATVLSYWMFAYRNSILTAHQRVDVLSKVQIVTDTSKYIFQIMAIVLVKNYYWYVVAILLSQIIQNIICAIRSLQLFPQYKPQGSLPSDTTKAINRRIKDLFTSKVGMVIVNSADNIVISVFLGLKLLAIYQNYFYILSAIIGVMSTIYSSCLAGIGNSLITETPKKNFIIFKRFTFMITWISGFCTICFLNLYQPFMELWMGKDLMLEYSAVICFSIYFFIYEINTLLNMFKDAAGIWHSDRFRPLATALTNLVMNLIMVNYWGVYGVLLSTVISTLFVGMPWLLHNLFSTVFDMSLIRKFLWQLLRYIAVIIVAAIMVSVVCSFTSRFNLLVQMITNLFICFIIPNILFITIFNKTDEFAYCLGLANKALKKITRRK